MIQVHSLLQSILLRFGGLPFTRRFCTYIGSILVVRSLLPEAYAEWAFAYAILAWTLSFFDDGIPRAMRNFDSSDSTEFAPDYDNPGCDSANYDNEEVLGSGRADADLAVKEIATARPDAGDAATDANSPYLTYGVVLAILSSCIITAVTLLFSIVVPLPMGTKLLRHLAGFIIIRGLFQSLLIYFQKYFERDSYHIITTTQSLLLLIMPVLGAWIAGLTGLVVANYLIYLIGIAMLIYFIGFKNLKKPFKVEFSSMPSITPFLHESVTLSQGRFVADTLFAMDVFWIAILIKDYRQVALYAVAALIPVALTAIPQMVMPHISPYLYEFRHNITRIKRLLLWSMGVLCIVNLCLGLSSFIIIPHSAGAIFGSFYAEAGMLFRFLLLAFFISGSFRLPAIIILASIDPKGKRIPNALICAGCNLVLDIPLIIFFGIYGAAVASLCSLIIGTLVALRSLWKYFARIEAETASDEDLQINAIS